MRLEDIRDDDLVKNTKRGTIDSLEHLSRVLFMNILSKEGNCIVIDYMYRTHIPGLGIAKCFNQVQSCQP